MGEGEGLVIVIPNLGSTCTTNVVVNALTRHTVDMSLTTHEGPDYSELFPHSTLTGVPSMCLPKRYIQTTECLLKSTNTKKNTLYKS